MIGIRRDTLGDTGVVDSSADIDGMITSDLISSAKVVVVTYIRRQRVVCIEPMLVDGVALSER